MGMVDKQNALASLYDWELERDDSQTEFPHRVYRDEEGKIYHSVTHILKETAPKDQKLALENWEKKPSSSMERAIACERGNLTHSNAEYILKLAAKLARQSANRKGVWSTREDGLERCPKAITKWALSKAAESAPKVSWSAAGYARGLRAYILERVTAIHAAEFSVLHPEGFAGTCDALLDIDGFGPVICDWKTSQQTRNEYMLTNYRHQLGAYSIALRHLTGIQAKMALIVVARRSGKPQIREMNSEELLGSELKFLERHKEFVKMTRKEELVPA